MEFSERLSELMEEREITAYKLSKDTGIAQSTLSEVINNKNKTLSTQNITKIANYFGCTIDYLLGRSPLPTAPRTRLSWFGRRNDTQGLSISLSKLDVIIYWLTVDMAI